MSSSHVVLRPERADDLGELSALLVAVDASCGAVPFRVAVRSGGLTAAHDVIARPKLDSVVAASNGTMIGYGALRAETDAVMLVNMLVHPQHQGRGVGRVIASELCSRVTARGEHVHLDVLLDSQAAHTLYRSLGFQEIGATAGKVSGRVGRLMCLAPPGSSPCQRDAPGAF